MRNLVLAAFTACALAGQAAAQQAATAAKPLDMWGYLLFTDGGMAWNLHAGRWSENNNVVEGQRLFWYNPPQVVDGQSIVWAQDFWKITCSANTFEIKSGEELSASLQTLFTLKTGAPYAIKPNSTDHLLRQIYCDNKTIASAQFADGLLGVMDAMQKAKAAQ